MNPDQLDTEIDGIGGVCDNCINTINPDQADENGDELGDACDTGDSDNDSMTDNNRIGISEAFSILQDIGSGSN